MGTVEIHGDIIEPVLDTKIWEAVAALPAAFQRDPADRIIVASAQVLGATLLTQDKRIIKSALVPTL